MTRVVEGDEIWRTTTTLSDRNGSGCWKGGVSEKDRKGRNTMVGRASIKDEGCWTEGLVGGGSDGTCCGRTTLVGFFFFLFMGTKRMERFSSCSTIISKCSHIVCF
jgi:hypothetical protein